MATKTVTGKVTGPDGSGKASVSVRATLSQACIIAGTQEIVPSIVTTSSAADGTYTLTLQANNDLAPSGTFYTVTESVPDGGWYQYTIVVPQSAGPFVITNIQSNPPTLGASPSHLSTLIVDTSITLPGGGSLFNGKPWFDVTHPVFGADPTGAVDAATAIQAAITAAEVSGGTVFFPVGTYKIGTGLVIHANSVRMQGSGFGTVLKPTVAVTTAVITTTQPATDVRHGIGLTDFKIDCTAQTSGDGIDLMGTYYADVRNIWILKPAVIGLYIDRAVGSTLPPAYNEFRNVHITNGLSIGIQIGGGANSGADFNKFFGCTVEFCGGGGSGNTNGIGLNEKGNFDEFHGCIFDANDTNALLTQVRGCRFISCTFDRAYKIGLRIVGGDNHRFTHLKGGDFVAGVLANQTQSFIELDTGTKHNYFDGVLLDSSSTLWLNSIREFSGVGPNYFSGLDMKNVPLNLWVRATVLPDCFIDNTDKPVATNGPAVGSGPPAASNIGTYFRGQVSLGTGTSTAIGRLCTVTLTTGAMMGPFSGIPYVSLTPASAGGTVKTSQLQLSVRNATITTFDIFCDTAPTASQSAGTYVINYTVDWSNTA